MTTELSQVITDIAAGPFGSNLKVECFVPSGFPIIDGANLKGFKVTDNITKFVTEEKAQSLHRSIAHRGDVVVTISGTIGQIAYIPEDSEYEAYLVSQRQFRVTFDDTQVFVPYLVYYFHTAQGQHQILSFANQTGVPALSQPLKNFKKITIDLPPLEEQRRIAGILGSLDDKIELNRRINANLEAQAQALFRSWFVDFEPFRDGPFVDSELGKIPQGWKVGNYTDIVEIKGGGTPKTGIQEYWDGTIPFFSPKDVGASCFVLDTEKHITAKGLENCNSSLFQTNTVFITARGTVGKVVMTGTEMAMNQTNYALLGKQNISQYYVYHITRQLVTRLLKKANGAVFNAITTRDFTSEQIIIPPFSTIRQFSDVVKPIYENILLNDVQSNRLSALRDILLPKLMAGEI